MELYWQTGSRMTINGCLAGLVGITGSCAYVSVGSSLIIGAIAGIIVVFSVIFFDRIRLTTQSAQLPYTWCACFRYALCRTLCTGRCNQPFHSHGLFFGGGFSLLGAEIIGIIAVGAFVAASSALVWFILKKTIGIRVSLEEEIQGLDIGEHGNSLS